MIRTKQYSLAMPQMKPSELLAHFQKKERLGEVGDAIRKFILSVLEFSGDGMLACLDLLPSTVQCFNWTFRANTGATYDVTFALVVKGNGDLTKLAGKESNGFLLVVPNDQNDDHVQLAFVQNEYVVKVAQQHRSYVVGLPAKLDNRVMVEQNKLFEFYQHIFEVTLNKLVSL